MSRRWSDGVVAVDLDTSGLLARLERAGERAAVAFVRTARRGLEELAEPYASRRRWPVDTGASADAFEVASELRQSELAMVLRNEAQRRDRKGWGLYAYKVKWSVRTTASLRREVEAAAARGKTATSRQAIRENMARRLRRRHGQGAPSEALAGRQPWRELRLASRVDPVIARVVQAVADEAGGAR